jgi:uncharacterized oligopeptide transporter (OPT) family protein
MAANVSAGAASQCADLLDDLKCGYLLGASPRWQAIAQMLGALVGALVGSAAYLLLVPDPARLGTDEWPAQAMLSWKAVAGLFADGWRNLPAGAAAAMGWAALAALVLAVGYRVGPRGPRRWLPSPVAFGFAFITPANLAIGIFAGGLMALLLRRWRPGWAGRYLVPVAAGLLAGESLTGIGTAFVQALTGHH